MKNLFFTFKWAANLKFILSWFGFETVFASDTYNWPQKHPSLLMRSKVTLMFPTHVQEIKIGWPKAFKVRDDSIIGKTCLVKLISVDPISVDIIIFQLYHL